VKKKYDVITFARINKGWPAVNQYVDNDDSRPKNNINMNGVIAAKPIAANLIRTPKFIFFLFNYINLFCIIQIIQ